MPRRARGRPFAKGKSGNPHGRPKGIQEPAPRTSMRAAWINVVTRHPKLVEKVIEAGLRLPPSKALPFMELGGRLTKELGAGLGAGGAPVIINFNSNVRPEMLRQPPPGSDAPEDGT